VAADGVRLLILGGSDAGISAGLRARELDPTADVTLLLADRFPNYSICGLPFHISGETPDWRDLAHRELHDLEAAGLALLLEHRAVGIAPREKNVRALGPGAEAHILGYDKLVIATGAEPVRPPIPGLDLPGVHLLHTMEDSFQVRERAAGRPGGRALVIGGGYIGLEMADAFSHRGLQVTVAEQLPAVMPTVDLDLGGRIGDELTRHGGDVVTGTTIEGVGQVGDRLAVHPWSWRPPQGSRRECGARSW